MTTLGAPLLFDRPLITARRSRFSTQASSFLPSFLTERVLSTFQERLMFTKSRFERVLGIGLSVAEAQSLFSFYALREWPAPTVVICEDPLEETLPFPPQDFDAVVSFGHLHWVNDVPGFLAQCRYILKPDGLFIGVLPGGATGHELRFALENAELTLTEGVSPRCSFMISGPQMGALLQRAGFALPVIDVDSVTIWYEQFKDLVTDLRQTANTNALTQRTKKVPSRLLFSAAQLLYEQTFGHSITGRLPATVDLIFFSAWAPCATQPKPLPPGRAFIKKSMLTSLIGKC